MWEFSKCAGTALPTQATGKDDSGGKKNGPQCVLKEEGQHQRREGPEGPPGLVPCRVGWGG